MEFLISEILISEDLNMNRFIKFLSLLSSSAAVECRIRRDPLLRLISVPDPLLRLISVPDPLLDLISVPDSLLRLMSYSLNYVLLLDSYFHDS